MTLFDAGGDPASQPAPSSLPPASRPDTAQRLLLVVAYDGTDFHGFAPQPEVRTVAGVLTDALETVLRRPVTDLTSAGRTDAGVHTWGQVVTLAADPGDDPDRVAHVVNRRLAPEVVVRSAAIVAASVDARRSARWRRYRYTVVNHPVPDPFLARHAWWVREPLDLRRMRLAADPFVGEHDFSAFSKSATAGGSDVEVSARPSNVRRVFESRFEEIGPGLLRYEIRANAFCWQMVRSIVGTLVAIGAGRGPTPGDVMRMLRTRDRAVAGPLAPPHGLVLWEVGYDPGVLPGTDNFPAVGTGERGSALPQEGATD